MFELEHIIVCIRANMNYKAGTYKQLVVTSTQSNPQYLLEASPTNNAEDALGELGLGVVGADVGSFVCESISIFTE